MLSAVQKPEWSHCVREQPNWSGWSQGLEIGRNDRLRWIRWILILRSFQIQVKGFVCFILIPNCLWLTQKSLFSKSSVITVMIFKSHSFKTELSRSKGGPWLSICRPFPHSIIQAPSVQTRLLKWHSAVWRMTCGGQGILLLLSSLSAR